MNLFDLLLTKPIFNMLAFIYSCIGDFGIAIIVLTILIRLAMLPIIKKQLHQTKIMHSIQPELKRIKQQAKGNKMLQSTMMLELYREKNIKPFRSILAILIQIPILIALFNTIQILSGGQWSQIHHVNAHDYIYPFLESFNRIPELLNGQGVSLLGIDLTKLASTYFPALVIAVLACSFQYYQTKQIMPNSADGRRLRDLFKDAANGKEIDQSDMMAATNQKMVMLMPIMTFVIALVLPAAVVLYYATSSMIAIIQQHFILNNDEEEMDRMASQKEPKRTSREKKAQEAVIVKKKDVSAKKPKGGGKVNTKTVVRRIKAK